MPIPFLNDIDLSGALQILAGTGYLEMNKTELRSAVIQNLAAEPASPAAGQIIYNTAKTDAAKGNGKLGYRTATSWVYPDMEKSVYDTDNDGIVDYATNSALFNSQTPAWYLNRANHTGSQLASTISDFTEATQDAIGAAFANTNSINPSYNDASNQMTWNVNVAAGGGIEIIAGGIQLTSIVTAGTYTKVTVDAKGRVTAGANLTSGDLPAHTHVHTDISDFDAGVRENRLDQLAAPAADVAFSGKKITNLSDPTLPQDAATKNYVDNAIQGIDAKDSVRAATTTNITLSGTQTIDGIALVAGDRCLVKNQTTPAQNGIYIVSASTWSRATDMDSWAEVVAAYCWVTQGSTQGDTGWYCTSDPGGTLGTTAITWTQFNSTGTITAGVSLQKTGNVIDLRYDPVTMAVNGSNQVTLATAYKNKKVTGTITGDASTTSFSINHSLANKDVVVDVYEATTGYTVFPLIERYDTNTVKVSFKTAPATGKVYNVVILG